MAETQAIAIGVPGYFDLSTIDTAAAQQFYGSLFGWSGDVFPDPEAGGYGMFKLEGKETAGFGPRQDPNQPPAWTMYVLVDDAQATTQRAKDAGGMAFLEPREVFEEGIMAILADPSGAVFGIWQPKKHGGIEVAHLPNTYAWSELHSRDVAAATAFFRAVFAWDPQESMGSPEDQAYTEFHVDGRSIAGGMAMTAEPAGTPSYWLVYFAVDDPDAAAAKATQLGASTLMPPSDFPGGRFAILQDPQGAAFGVLRLQRS